ncbi:MAG: anaerobic ribonucleoside-triphosphate reductase activating protein [Patescibacteria group bacterium]
MKIAGLQKMTLIDYPGKIAATVFTSGCNFRCPFCHNPELVNKTQGVNLISETQLLDFLESRRKYLDAVCFTGGEPLLHEDIIDLLKKVKAMGFLVKIDTNGTNPELLKKIVNEKLADYVAMDIKAPLDWLSYKKTINVDNKELLDKVKESVKFLLSVDDKIDCEFRTTVVPKFLKLKDIEIIAQQIKGAKKYSIQQFINSGKMIDKTLVNVKPYSKEDLEEACEIARKYVGKCYLKNV